MVDQFGAEAVYRAGIQALGFPPQMTDSLSECKKMFPILTQEKE